MVPPAGSIGPGMVPGFPDQYCHIFPFETLIRGIIAHGKLNRAFVPSIH